MTSTPARRRLRATVGATRRGRWLVLAAGGVWFAVVAGFALSGTRREFVGVDDASGSVAHLIAFAGLAAVLYVAFGPGRRRWVVAVAILVACAAAGSAIELAQLARGGRTAEASDVVFDVLGAWLGLATAVIAASSVGWRSLRAGTLGLLGLSLGILPFARTTDDFDVASIDESLDCPTRDFLVSPHASGPAEPHLEYLFDEADGVVVHERNGRTDLTIGDRSAVEWTDDGLRIIGEPALVSDDPPTGFVDAVVASDELSVEAWMVADRLPQEGPARIVTISRGTRTGDVDVHLGIERRGISARIRTDCDLFNWTIAEDVLTADELHHVVATYRPGEVVVYVDGEPVTVRRLRVGTLDIWDDEFDLHLGDEAGGNRPFRGTLAAVALFDRAIDAESVAARYAAGPG